MLLPILAVLQAASGPPNGQAGRTATVYMGVQTPLDVATPRIEGEIDVDGFLGEEVWSSAAVLTGFSQYRPVNATPLPDRKPGMPRLPGYPY